MSDLTGKTVAGYPIEKRLSKGAYDEIYQAASSGAPLAVRVLRDDLRGDNALNAAIAKGWETARAAVHANLVTMYSAAVDPAAGAYALEELPPGKPIRQMMIGGSKVAWRDCLVLCEQIFTALKALHDARVCHGCVWSGSVLITQDQDLKLEAAGGLSLTDHWPVDLLRGAAIGYLAPEVVQGSPITPESDIYGAGACVYCIMVGQDPFPGEDSEALARHVLERKPPNASALRDDLPPEADEFLNRLMARDPTQRYGSVDDVLADLARLKAGDAMAPLKGGRPAAAPRPRVGAAPEPPPAAPHPVPDSKARGKITGLMAAVKGPPGTKVVVFGRLDTHVKSTIPQSDPEKKGDDYYRQGQLAMALATWRDAYLHATPHAALKTKIELGEVDLQKERYSLAIEESRYRLEAGDFRGAITRAREALDAAKTNDERQGALSLESEGLARSQEAERVRRVKVAIVSALFAVLVVFALWWLSRAGTEPPPVDEGYVEPGTSPADKAPSLAGKTGSSTLTLTGGATITVAQGWTQKGNEVLAPGATEGLTDGRLRLIRCPDGAALDDRLAALKKGDGLKDLEVREEVQQLGTFVDGLYRRAMVSLQYTAGEQMRLRCCYLVGGPQESLYEAEYDGPADRADLYQQAQTMVQSWTYQR
jgi:hypothetical protein